MTKRTLDGVRVLELGGRWAAPHCTEILGDMGAQVIKVESSRGDASRGVGKEKRGGRFYAPVAASVPPYNRAGSFLMMNRNKLSIGLDYNKVEGKELLRQLVKVSDVLVENVRPGLLDKLGLGYEDLKLVNPGLIMCSLSGFGKTGPDRFRRAVGVTIEPYCIASVTGYPDGGPMRSGVDHNDPVAGAHGAAAITAALVYRKRTGKGLYIDVAFTESLVAMIGPSVLDYGANRRLPERCGNISNFMAPHGCYRCNGDDKWIAIAVRDDRDWQQLCKALGSPSFIDDERFKDSVSRWHYKEELDQWLGGVFSKMDHREAMSLLQSYQVPSGAVLNIEEMVNDPHLKARGFFTEVPYPAAEDMHYKSFGARFKLSKTPISIYRRVPCYGENNKEVWVDIVGIEEARLRSLVQRGIVFDEPEIGEEGGAF